MNIIRPATLGTALLIAAGAFAFSVASISDASASHFRGGNVSWTAGAEAGEIEFKVTTYYRRSYPISAFQPLKEVGDTVTYQTFSFGDGSTAALNYTVTQVNAASDWMQLTATLSHTYSSGTNFTAFLTSCCRISSLENSSDTSYRLQTSVNLNNGSSPDEGSTSPIFLVPDDGIVTFNPFQTTDPDGGPFTYAFSTPSEGGAGTTVPAGMTIDAVTGDITWDTTAAGADVGELWMTSFIVSDANGNTAPLEILLSMCDPGSPGCGDFEAPDPQVSEPATLAAFGLGLAGLALRKRRRRNA